MALENTHYSIEQLTKIFSGSKKKIFFDGIGGISMNSLAHIAMLRGNEVCGYDRTPSSLTMSLEKEGIKIWYDSDASHIDDCDALIYTVAIPEDNPEYKQAEKSNIPRISRANYLGYLMMKYRSRIGVCGMHGKSTTTSMLESVFSSAGLDPTVNCGAKMADIGTAHRIGKNNDYFIFEACEYTDSFLDLYPTIAVVLNIDRDHPDYFKSMDQTINSFSRFLAKSSTAVINAADQNTMTAAKDFPGRIVTFGADFPSADYSSSNLKMNKGFASFDVNYKGVKLFSLQMSVPGKYIVVDALAAAAAACESGIDPDDVRLGLSKFNGALRRMQFCGKTENGASVYTDYAHHPTEIKATLDTAAEMGFEKIFCVFQPHTYSRTQELYDRFVDALANSNATEIILSPIYSARELNTYGVSSDKLGESIRKLGKKCTFFSSMDEISDYVANIAGKKDMILIMGAGDIIGVVRMLPLVH